MICIRWPLAGTVDLRCSSKNKNAESGLIYHSTLKQTGTNCGVRPLSVINLSFQNVKLYIAQLT